MRFHLFLSLIVIAFLSSALYSLDYPPMKPKTLLIKDNEFLKYDNFIGGEKYQDIYIVSRIQPDSKIIQIFIGKHNVGSPFLMPKNYTNFQRQFEVALDTGSLVRSFGDYRDQYKTEKKTGEVYFSLEIDWKRNAAVYTAKIWDGYDMMTKTSRVPIKTGYPVWDVPSVAFVATRYLDYESKGMIYGVVPATVKEAVPVMARFIKKETIEVPAGRFQTIKLGVGIPDAFLANLLETYVKEMFVWVEDSPRSLVIQTQSPTELYKLREIGEWQEP